MVPSPDFQLSPRVNEMPTGTNLIEADCCLLLISPQNETSSFSTSYSDTETRTQQHISQLLEIDEQKHARLALKCACGGERDGVKGSIIF